MKRFYMIIVSLVAFVGGTMAQQHEYVELVKDAPVYSSASESSTKLSSDVESVFKAFFYNGQVFYPFTQKVIDTKGAVAPSSVSYETVLQSVFFFLQLPIRCDTSSEVTT